MATETTTPAPDMAAFAQLIADGVAAGIEKNQPPKKVTFGRYDPRTIYHPNKATAQTMKRDYFQNGYRLQYDNTFDREIELLNQITHSGRYLNRMVEVIVSDEGDPSVDIRFKSRTADQRFEMMKVAKDFIDMLEQIIAAQREEDDEALDKATRPNPRHFGDTKATREARAKAGV